MAGIAMQGQMMAQLSYIVDQLKVTLCLLTQHAAVTAVYVAALYGNSSQ